MSRIDRKQTEMSQHFIPGSEAKRPFFYGRAAQLTAVGSQRWALVFGQRRMGKSSLLHAVAERWGQQGWLALYFTFGSLVNPCQTDGAALLEQFIRVVTSSYELDRRQPPLDHQDRQFIEALRKQFLEDPRTTLPEEQTPVDGFRKLVDRIYKRFRGVVFLWDEAESLAEIEAFERGRHPTQGGFLAPFHEAFQDDDRFRLVLAGSQLLFEKLYNCRVRSGNSFLESFRWVPLPGLAADEARDLLLCKQTRKRPQPFAKVVSEAVRWSGGHPWVLHKLGQLLTESQPRGQEGNRRGRRDLGGLCQQFVKLIVGRRRSVDRSMLDRCFEDVVQDELTGKIFLNDFTHLTDAQQAVMERLCRDEDETGVPENELCGLRDGKGKNALRFLRMYGYASQGNPVRLGLPFYRKLYHDYISCVPGKASANDELLQQIRPALLAGDSQVAEEPRMTEGRRIEALRDFLRDSFRRSQLEQFLTIEGYSDVVRVVGSHEDMTKYAYDVVVELHQQGRIDPVFFDCLARARPGKRPEIERLRNIWLDGNPTDLKPPGGPLPSGF
jgi:hypothetical protein